MSSKPCLKTLPCQILQTPFAGQCLDTHEKSSVCEDLGFRKSLGNVNGFSQTRFLNNRAISL